MRRANAADKPIIVDILTRAFDTNKSVNYIVRQDARRVDRMRTLMSYSFDVCDKFGEVWISDARDACALILFMDKKRTSLRTLLWDLRFAVSVVGLGRVGEILKREAMIKSNHPKEPFAYLWFFGVDPGVHNKGVGSAFLEEIIRECDRKKRPIYLETSMEKNLPFYKKFGFEIFNTVQPTYTLYLLRRP
jgi:ribosomal protein S18 acetylase RimI-like enzyme